MQCSAEASFRERSPTEEAATRDPNEARDPNEVRDSNEVKDPNGSGCFKVNPRNPCLTEQNILLQNCLAAMMRKVRPSSPLAGPDIELVRHCPYRLFEISIVW